MSLSGSLPPRHLETLLQGLCAGRKAATSWSAIAAHHGRRDRARRDVADYRRSGRSWRKLGAPPLRNRSGLRRVGKTFLGNLDAITVEQTCETAEKSHVLDDEKVSGDFAV
jgi:hypothetical protein